MKKFALLPLFLVFFFLSSPPFSSGFSTFLISPESASFSLDSLNTVSQDLTISFNPLYDLSQGDLIPPYKIHRTPVCTDYDEEFVCTHQDLNLCPYIAISPNNEEVTEIGFTLEGNSYEIDAKGELDVSNDLTDKWKLSVTSPCFEGECPSDYYKIIDSYPLPQNLKGQTFKCEVSVEYNGPVFQMRNLATPTYAATSNIMTVSAVLTGAGMKKIDPVIIIPGIMGSAYKNGKLVIDPILHTYDDLIATLDENGYTKNVDLFTFPYEWRDSNVSSANLLDDKIDEVKNICNCSKVDLVAHSMGGLVARSYIQSGIYDQDVDQVIFLGTPHKGAPAAYLEWEGGEFEEGGINFLKKQFFTAEAHRSGYDSLFDYIHGRPISSVGELLPIFDYLKDQDTGVLKPYPNNYPQNNFLRNLDENIFKLLNSGVKITNIVGNVGSQSTTDKIRVRERSSPLWIDGKPDSNAPDGGLEKGVGDRLVSLKSSTLDPSIQNEEWNSQHSKLPTETEARIFNLLTGKIADKTFTSTFIEKLFLIHLQSPIDVVVTAPDGKKIGKNFNNGGEFEEIPNAFYSGYQTDDEYITIPNPLDGEYKIEVQGTGNGGEYGVVTSYISDNFATSTETIGTTQPNQITKLEAKVDNENLETILETKKIITSEVLLNDINKSYELGWITGKNIKDNLIRKAERIIKTEQRGKNVEKKVDGVSARALIVDLRGYQRSKINEKAYNIIKEDLEWLINN